MTKNAPIKEIKLTDYLSVGLDEENRIYTYIKGIPIHQCRYVVCTAPSEAPINSVDDLIKKYGLNNPNNKPLITPEEELWVHASNLHAWVEHGYNKNMIHSVLYRSLIKRLCLVDPNVEDKVLNQYEEDWNLGNHVSRTAIFKDRKSFPFLLLLAREGRIDKNQLKVHISYLDFLLKKYRKGGPHELEIVDVYTWHEDWNFRKRIKYHESKIWGDLYYSNYSRYRKSLNEFILILHDTRDGVYNTVVSSPADYPAYLWSKPHTKEFREKWQFRGSRHFKWPSTLKNYNRGGWSERRLQEKMFRWVKVPDSRATLLGRLKDNYKYSDIKPEYVYIYYYDLDYYRHNRYVTAITRLTDGSYRTGRFRI